MTQSPATFAKTHIQTLLHLLDITATDIAVTQAKDATISIDLTLPDTESGILIGYHAETLSSLQRILNLILHHQLKEWHRVIINVNHYRQNREQVLNDMAHNAAERVRLTHQEVIMPYLDSFERRLIHLALADSPDIETVSVGEGRDRRLVIRPHSQDSPGQSESTS
ncbi:MAG: KH domain-containing protein [Candidatus Chisholmbacteria bacterium]|nr:KH domain-containing protein [Candidatus Chisholmbacteria bacterium]